MAQRASYSAGQMSNTLKASGMLTETAGIVKGIYAGCGLLGSMLLLGKTARPTAD